MSDVVAAGAPDSRRPRPSRPKVASLVGLPLAALIALALAAAPRGAAAGSESTQAPPQVSAANSLPVEVVEAIRAAVTDEMSRFGIPGLSLAVAGAGEVRHEAGFGFSDVENSVPARPETVYRLASVSKPITAAAVMKLADQGRLDLDAPVWRYCRDFPEKPWPVTARQLLCHQGGVRHYRPDEQPVTRRFTSLLDGLALFKDDPLSFEPGTKVLYSTYGYTLLGCVAANAASEPFPSLLEESVFRPAGMAATGVDDLRALVPNRAQGYVRGADGQLLNSALADMTYKVPGGGLCGTASDVARFGTALLSGRLVSPETLRRMLTPQKTRDGRATGFGLGLTIGSRGGRREAWHTGGQERVSTVLYLRPDAGLAVAILANLEKVLPQALDLARRVADLASGQPVLRGPVTSDTP
jgi:CubicO group peptidase (beta-lactamase class C family)